MPPLSLVWSSRCFRATSSPNPVDLVEDEQARHLVGEVLVGKRPAQPDAGKQRATRSPPAVTSCARLTPSTRRSAAAVGRPGFSARTRAANGLPSGTSCASPSRPCGSAGTVGPSCCRRRLQGTRAGRGSAGRVRAARVPWEVLSSSGSADAVVRRTRRRTSSPGAVTRRAARCCTSGVGCLGSRPGHRITRIAAGSPPSPMGCSWKHPCTVRFSLTLPLAQLGPEASALLGPTPSLLIPFYLCRDGTEHIA